MTLIHFNVSIDSPDLMDMDLPIEVRDTKMKLIGETTASQPMSVPAGARYVVIARFPAGQTVSDVVDAEGDAVHAILAPETDETTHKPATALYFASMRAQASAPPPPLPAQSRRRSSRIGATNAAPPLPAATMRFFGGNTFQSAAEPLMLVPEKQPSTSRVAELTLPPAEELRFLQCAHEHLPPLNVALPISQQNGCSIVIHREATRYWVEVHPKHQQAKLLLGYAQNQWSQNESALATRLVFDKFDDPIAATVGGYSLLRVARLESATGAWLANLMASFEWLPDGAALRGEHLARSGQHTEALNAFIKVTERGLPLFSDGIRYTYDRLRFYADAEAEMPSDAARARNALSLVKKFVQFVDFTKSITTYYGSDPNHPGPSVPLTDAGGMSVASLFT